MITVWTTRNPLDAAARTIESVPFRHGLRVRDVVPGWVAEARDVRVTVDGREAGLETMLRDYSRVEVVERPGFIFTLASFAGLAKIGAAIVNAAAAFAVSFGVSYLLGAGRKPKQPGEQDSPTYTFTGIRSEPDAQGAAIPVVYGEHLVSGVRINQFTRVSLIGTELYVLLLLSEGRIEAIGDKTADGGPFTTQAGNLPVGMLINGQPAEDFEEVEVHVRMGDTDQAAIPGFANAEQILDVGSTLDQSASPGPGNVEIVPKSGGYDPGDVGDAAELDKWDTEEVYTMDAEGDEFGVLVEFPGGLYTTNTGGIAPNTAEFQIRYRALDGGGSPTGNYVVLSPEPPVAAANTNPFTVEFRHPLYSAASYVAAGAGERLVLDGVNDYVSVATPMGFPSVTVDDMQLSVGLWLYVTSAFPVSNGTTSYLVAEQFGSNKGWRIILDLTRSGGPTYIATMRVILGTGSGTITKSFNMSSSGNPAVWINEWHFFGFSFNNQAFGPAQSRYRRSYDGTTFGETNGAHHERNDTATIYVGDTPTASESPLKGFVDGFKVWGRELEVSEWAQQYNGGLGFNGNGNEPNLVLAWLFDSSSGGDTPDLSPNGNDGTLSGASISTGQAGLISGTPGGTITRGKYRIEVQRLDAVSTDLNENDAVWSQVRITQFEQFEYPGYALMAVKVRADGQLQGGAPEIAVPVKGLRVPQWDGASELAPTAPKSWSTNPAWVCLDALTATPYALGDYYSLTDIDLPAFADWAAYCAELVEDGRESRGGGNTVTLTYSSGTLTIEITDVTDGAPEHWAVGGYLIVRDATDASYNDVACEILSIDYDPVAETLDIEVEWPSTSTAPSAGPTADATAEVIGAEQRHRWDGVFDRRNADGWDGVLAIMQAGRASPIRRGSKLSVFVDRAAEPVGTVSMSNIVQGSFQIDWISQHDRTNSVTIEILDRDNKYRRTPVTMEHATLIDPSTFVKRRERSYSLEGVTRRSEAMRHAQYELNMHHLQRRRVTWEMPLDGLQFEPGDVVRITHDMPGWAPSGLFRAGTDSSTLYLDRAVTIAPGDFAMTVQQRGTGEAFEFVDSGPSGTYAAGDAITLTTPAPGGCVEGNQWILTSEVPYQLHRIVDVSLDPRTLTRRFVALSYNPDVYDDGFADFLNAPSTLPVPGSGLLFASTVAPPPVRNLRSATRSHETTDGSLASYVELSWEPGSDAGQRVERHEIWVADGVSRRFVLWHTVSGTEYRAEVPIRGLDSARDWYFQVRPVGPNNVAKRLGLHARVYWQAPERTAPRRTASTTWPTDPRDGDMNWFETDRDWYRWDASRSKWLGTRTIGVQFGLSTTLTNANSSFSSSGPTSWPASENLAIIRVDFFQATSATTTVDIKVAGSTVHSVTATSSRVAVDAAVDETINQGQLLVAYINGTATNGHGVLITLCRYYT
jgi:hypothetical protein